MTLALAEAAAYILVHGYCDDEEEIIGASHDWGVRRAEIEALVNVIRRKGIPTSVETMAAWIEENA